MAKFGRTCERNFISIVIEVIKAKRRKTELDIKDKKVGKLINSIRPSSSWVRVLLP